ncbi:MULTISPECIES: hypothetical protein [Bacillus]|uniref:hypothetical protein n=1 Tax=Bacillus TaxID=1386 RepID=UPI0005A08C11|nr:MULTISPECIES: hypothetical protein [Bacillus]MDO7347981.1 hypothetical protein [Bacillus stercoris]QRZ93465.1 hypothetical protein JQX68_02885 [Bacillus sp. LJBS06]TII13945.1 hypothetical protein C6Y43_17285 [Bacillus subtilis]BEV38891.1 hypothetical protein BSB_19640 [Bacillus stercoris]
MRWSKWFNIFCIVALGSIYCYKLLTNQEVSTTRLIIASAIVLWNIVGLFSKDPVKQTQQAN